MATKTPKITPTPLAEEILPQVGVFQAVPSSAENDALKSLAKDFLFTGLTTVMDVYASKLAAKDVNTTGVDDAIALELHAFANKIRMFQITGEWKAAV